MGPTERVWEGRLHLGDEPGIYGDAAYAGLAVELPVTLHRMSQAREAGESVEFIVETQDVRVFEGYRGHRVDIVGFFADPAAQPEWQRRVLHSGRMTQNGISLVLDGDIPSHVSVGIHVVTDVGPGRFAYFLGLRVSFSSRSHLASQGFRAGG
jgi:hypothetical protein